MWFSTSLFLGARGYMIALKSCQGPWPLTLFNLSMCPELRQQTVQPCCFYRAKWFLSRSWKIGRWQFPCLLGSARWGIWRPIRSPQFQPSTASHGSCPWSCWLRWGVFCPAPGRSKLGFPAVDERVILVLDFFWWESDVLSTFCLVEMTSQTNDF